MVMETLKRLSLGELVTKLHESIVSVAKSIAKLSERNREISLSDIVELRNHIKERLQLNEETVENQKLLKLIELFKEDKNALELVKIDLEEWVDFLEAIKFHLEERGEGLDKEEAKELNKLKKDITSLQNVLRRQAGE